MWLVSLWSGAKITPTPKISRLKDIKTNKVRKKKRKNLHIPEIIIVPQKFQHLKNPQFSARCDEVEISCDSVCFGRRNPLRPAEKKIMTIIC